MNWRGIAASAFAYLALAILQTYPLIRHLGTHVPGLGLGDNVSFLWNVWWMREALASPAADFFFSPMVFAPLGAPLILHTHTAAMAWIGAAVLPALTVAEARNVLLIASLALNGWSVCLLAQALTRHAAASFVAGALFLVSPLVAARLMGHDNLVAVWPLVFACLAFVTWWRRPDWRRGLCLGVAAGALPFFDYYYSVFFIVFAVTYGAAACVHVDVRRAPRSSRTATVGAGLLALIAAGVAIAIALGSGDRLAIAGIRISTRTPTNALTAAWLLGLIAWLSRWRWRLAIARWPDPRPALSALALPAAIALILSVPLAAPAWRLWQDAGYVTQSSGLRSGPAGVDAGSLVLGPPFHGVIGAPVRRLYERFAIDPIESTAWIGWGTLVLAVLSWRERLRQPEIRRWSSAAIVFAVWALGPYLVILGHNTGAILAAGLLRLLPIVNNARIPGRALIPAALCACVLAAFSLAGLRARGRTLVGATLVAMAIGESLAAPLPLARLPAPGVHARIAADATGAAVLPIPFGIRDGFGEQGRVEPDAIYGQTVHRHPAAGGFVARLPPAVGAWYRDHEPYATLLRLSEGRGDPPAVTCEAALRGLEMGHVAYAVLYRADASPRLVEFVGTLPLVLVAEDGMRTLFRVTGCPSTG